MNGVEISIVAMIILLLALLGYPASNSYSDEDAYSAWTKLYPKASLKYEEWDALRERNMLPGQTQPSYDGVAEGAAEGMAIGMMLGAAAGR